MSVYVWVLGCYVKLLDEYIPMVKEKVQKPLT